MVFIFVKNGLLNFLVIFFVIRVGVFLYCFVNEKYGNVVFLNLFCFGVLIKFKICFCVNLFVKILDKFFVNCIL